MTGKRTTFKFIATLIVVALLTVALLQPAATKAPKVRVIVQGTSVDVAASTVLDYRGTVEAEIDIINSVVAWISQDQVTAIEMAPGILRVSPDREVELVGDGGEDPDLFAVDDLAAAGGEDVEGFFHGGGGDRQAADVEFSKSIGVSEVWESRNVGQGITVAVLDTGIDPRFPELRRTFWTRGDRFLAYYDAINEELYERSRMMRSPRDGNGHGTHVAGIIANGSFEWQDREFRGVAPGANLVSVRVLNEEGAGTYADVLKGLNWVVQNKDTYNIRVLNISMYAVPVAPYWADPYNLAVMAAWEAGITVIASAGNTGPAPMSIGVPGNTPYVVTVGAFTDHRTPEDFSDDYIPEFSAAGPTLDAFTKPDVIAPGAHVVSLMRPNTYLREMYPERRINGRYFEMSGSSMSTAVVSGIAALILQEHPDLSPDEVKYRLVQAARPQMNEAMDTAAYSIWQQGAGRVWASDAVLGDIEGAANQGMNIVADLNGEQHYQGWTVYDEESGTFQIVGGGFEPWVDGYMVWDGSFYSWADGWHSWADGATNWAGSFYSWADSFYSWADSFYSWADGWHSWADSFYSWADGWHSWADLCVDDSEQAAEWTDGWNSWADDWNSWADGWNSWADGWNSWADATTWTDGFYSWADGFHSWADSFYSWADEEDWSDNDPTCGDWVESFYSWADGFYSWADGLDTVSDGLNVWTGAYTTWEGGYMTWADGFHSWADGWNSWADGFSYWAAVCAVDADGWDSWADGWGSWADGFDSWADGFDSWADYVAWVDGFDSWADGFASWADGFNSWADSSEVGLQDPSRPVLCANWTDGFDSWADGFDSWADGFSSWADANPNLAGSFSDWDGGYTAWAGGFDSWADGFDSWADNVGDPTWAAGFCNLTNQPDALSPVNINIWIGHE
jgi:subtilisin family serine protease